MNPRVWILAIAVLSLSIVSSPASAAWPIHHNQLGPLVSDAEPLEQVEACISDGRGGVIVLVHSLRPAAPGRYVQHVRADGTMAWAANGVRVGPLGGSAEATPDGSGGVLVAWEDETLAPSNKDIRAQRVDSSGVRQWGTEGVLVCSQTANQDRAIIVNDGAGGAVVAWMDARNVATGTDLYAQRVLAAGTMAWTAQGVIVCNETGTQGEPQIVRDASGAFVIVFQDHRDEGSSGVDLYAQRLNTSGARMWRSDGVVVTVAFEDQTDPILFAAADGSTTVVWDDARFLFRTVHAQRLSAAGARQYGDGLAMLATTSSIYLTSACMSGEDVIVSAYRVASGVNTDAYAQRLTPQGDLAWGQQGVPVHVTPNPEYAISMHADGQGGAILILDSFDGIDSDIIAQRVNVNGVTEWTAAGLGVVVGRELTGSATALTSEGGVIVAASIDPAVGGSDARVWRIDARGVLGDPRPAISRVVDVAADQGGQVAVEWTASTHDVEPDRRIAQYSVWRDVPTSLVAERARVAKRPLRAERFGATTLYWEHVATQVARARPGYSAIVATTTDSMPGSNPRTTFMVSAETSGGVEYWDSATSSGYSVDNLAPATPSPFNGVYAATATTLNWGAGLEPDLVGYRLYRGSMPGFATDPTSLVAALSTTLHVDPTIQPWFYKLTAVDVHGNESVPALLLPQGTLDVGDALPLHAHFAVPRPNPVRVGEASQLRFALATAGPARLDLYDAQGRIVRELAAGEHAAGEHAVEFDGRDAAGRQLAPGLYLARIDAPGLRATRRVVIVD